MAWFADLAGRAESLLNNIDEQTGAAIRNHGVPKKKDKQDFSIQAVQPDVNKRKSIIRPLRKKMEQPDRPESRFIPSNLSRRTTNNPTRPIIKSQSQQEPKKPFLRKGGSLINNTTVPAPPLNTTQMYNLNNCPKTMMDEDNDLFLKNYKQRRFSLPNDLQEEEIPYRMQNLEIENAMLKNELHVVNREVSELLERLRKTEEELSRSIADAENLKTIDEELKHENENLNKHIANLKETINDCNNVNAKSQSTIHDLETQLSICQENVRSLEEKLANLNAQKNDAIGHNKKMENEVKHAQDVIRDLEQNLDKTHAECTRLEKNWDSYKVRVKNILAAKDSEIKNLQAGINLTEDTKLLMEQLDCLKNERDEMTSAIGQLRSQCGEMRSCMDQLEHRSSTAERLVNALREALREERHVKVTLEGECVALTKQLKSLQHDTGQVIATLRSELQEREDELNRFRDTEPDSVSSALNVADYDTGTSKVEDSNDKLAYLTQSLISRQGKIDALMADKSQLKIQLERLESKYKMEIAKLHDAISDKNIINSLNSGAAVRKGVVRRVRTYIKRNFIIKSALFVYMLGLHFLVSMVLWTNNPDIFSMVMKEEKEENDFTN